MVLARNVLDVNIEVLNACDPRLDTRAICMGCMHEPLKALVVAHDLSMSPKNIRPPLFQSLDEPVAFLVAHRPPTLVIRELV